MNLPTVNVIIPQPHEPNRGVHATTHESASRVVIRTNYEQRKVVQAGATMLQLSEAEFMRASSYNMAKALLQQEKEHVERQHNRSG